MMLHHDACNLSSHQEGIQPRCYVFQEMTMYGYFSHLKQRYISKILF